MEMIIAGVILLVVIILVVVTYNKMILNKNRVLEAWSGVDVFLKKRYDIIPNLVETVKGYASHERTTLENVTRYRSQAMSANSLEDKIESERQLSHSLGRLLSVRERYPELKANTNFMHLQEEIVSLEDEIEKSRRYYNGTVRENNVCIESFPANIVAMMFNFQKKPFFEINEAERETPRISF